jgi:integrase
VFHRNGRPVGDYRDAVHTARVKAGLPDFLVHDLRRSAVRNLTRAGIPEAVAMSLSGHLTRSVFDRYNITSGEDQREAVRKIAARHPGVEEPEPKVVAMVSRGRGVE